MKVYIYDNLTGKKEKLCEAKKGNAHHLRQLWIDNYNRNACSAKAIPVTEDDSNLLIVVTDKLTK